MAGFPSNVATAEHLFSYKPPTPEQVPIYEAINAVFLEAAKKLAGLMPEGADAVVALRKLAEARMATNAAVALAPPTPPRSFNMPTQG